MTSEVWLRFLGAWLLVAGPLFQGVLEIRDEGATRADVESAMADVDFPPRPSRWWWLLPPVMLRKRRRRSADIWRQVFDRLPAEQAARIRDTRPRTYGWFMVSAGGFLLAISETAGLTEFYDAPPVVAPLIVVGAVALTLLNVAWGLRRTGDRATS